MYGNIEKTFKIVHILCNIILLILAANTKHRTIENPREGVSTLVLDEDSDDDHYVRVEAGKIT